MTKEIPGFDGKYLATDDGHILSTVKGFRQMTEYTRRRYLAVYLMKNREGKAYSVHRLIAITFIGENESKKCINHKNGIKTDNRASNLEWCTILENNRHARASGLRKTCDGDYVAIRKVAPLAWEKHRSFSKQDIETVFSMRSSGFSQNKIANHFNCDQSQISRILSRQAYKHMEAIW